MRSRQQTLLSILVMLAVGLVVGGPAEAQPGTLFVEGDAVGIGTEAPGSTSGFGGVQAKLHLQTADGGDGGLLVENTSGTDAQRVLFELRNHGNVGFGVVNTSNGVDWRVQNFKGRFRVTKVGTGVGEFDLRQNGDLYLVGEIFTSGSCQEGCDRIFEADYPLESIEEHAARMWADKHLPAVGPTPESGTVNLSQKTLGMLNELEKAHIFIHQLSQSLEVKEADLRDLKAQNAELRDRLARIEQLLEVEPEQR